VVPESLISSSTRTEAGVPLGSRVFILAGLTIISALGAGAPAVATTPASSAVREVPAVQAKLAIRPAGIRDGRAMITRTVRVVGSLTPFRNGQQVRIRFYRDGRPLFSRKIRVSPGGSGSGSFESAVVMRKGSRYGVEASYSGAGGAEPVTGARTTRKSWRVGYDLIRPGACGPMVRGFRNALNRLALVPGGGRCLRGKTSRAVLAYRKMNGMTRSFRASSDVVQRVFNGRGRYRVRRPDLGDHAEAPLHRQVLVFAKGRRPYAIFPVSTGKASTPTIRGTYRFYRKDPGINAIGMYYSSYFIRGYAIHGYKSVPNYPASAGCLRTFNADQPRIYGLTRIGQPIHVYGRGR
jgi:hypothetical protein